MSLSDGDKAWLQAFFTTINHRFDQVEAAIGEANNRLQSLEAVTLRIEETVGVVRRDLVEHAARTGHRDDRDEATIEQIIIRDRSAAR
jgi:hypothetical protein